MATQTISYEKGFFSHDRLANANKTVYNDALAASMIVAASPCVLLELHAYSTNGAAQYVQVFDSATLPADDAVPRFTMAVAANSAADLPFPVVCESGCVVCISSTDGTKTIGSADTFFEAIASVG